MELLSARGNGEGQEGSDVAEIAVTVKTGWRRSGIGTQLVAMLEKAALARGIVAFDAMYLAGNDGASGLMKRAGFHIEDVDAGIVTVRKELVAGDPA